MSPAKTNSPKQATQGPGEVRKKRRNSVQSDDSDKKAPAISFEVYHSEAVTFQSIGEYRKAINSYTKALELKPKDKNCCISRAQCNLLLGETEKSLADANETLKDDNKYIKGILMKAESYYQMMQFEYALMFYHRGNKLRPEVQAFRLGIQKSREAIENSIGENAGIQLRSKGDLSYFYEDQQTKPKPVVTYNIPTTKVDEVLQERQFKYSCKNSKTCKQLLGELYADKEFLEKLLKESEAQSNQSDTNKAVRNLAIRGLDYLDTRTEFWQQQKPMYSRRRDRNIRDNAAICAAPDRTKTNSHWVLKALEEIDEAQAQGKYKTSLKQAKKTLKDVERLSDDSFRNRPEFLANLHSCIGNAHLELAEYTEALEHHNADYDIARKSHLSDAESRALDNLGRVHARMGNFDKAVQVWKKRLPMNRSPLESTWLYHEIGRCHLEMGDFEEARDFGEKSLSAAEEVDDGVWQLNALVLIAQSQVKGGELYSATDTFERAQDLARSQKDEAADLAIQKAIDDINESLDKKEGNNRESGRSSSKHSSRRHSTSSNDERKSEAEDDGDDDDDNAERRSKDSDDDRERSRNRNGDSSDDDTKNKSSDETTPRKKRNSVSSESQKEQSDEEDEEEDTARKETGDKILKAGVVGETDKGRKIEAKSSTGKIASVKLSGNLGVKKQNETKTGQKKSIENKNSFQNRKKDQGQSRVKKN